MSAEYNVAVIGGGMIGSAAARHLPRRPAAAPPNLLIGPTENQVSICQARETIHLARAGLRLIPILTV